MEMIVVQIIVLCSLSNGGSCCFHINLKLFFMWLLTFLIPSLSLASERVLSVKSWVGLCLRAIRHGFHKLSTCILSKQLFWQGFIQSLLWFCRLFYLSLLINFVPENFRTSLTFSNDCYFLWEFPNQCKCLLWRCNEHFLQRLTLEFIDFYVTFNYIVFKHIFIHLNTYFFHIFRNAKSKYIMWPILKLIYIY